MLKLGVPRLLIAFAVGLVIPYGLFRLSRLVGSPLLIGFAVALGLAYGAVKADGAWTGDGPTGNVGLMATSALVLAAYVAVSVAAARAIARRL